jgi:sugar lactone lactonase YvrE
MGAGVGDPTGTLIGKINVGRRQFGNACFGDRKAGDRGFLSR